MSQIENLPSAECWMSPKTAMTGQHCSSKDFTLLAALSSARLVSRASSALICTVFKQSLPSYTCKSTQQRSSSTRRQCSSRSPNVILVKRTKQRNRDIRYSAKSKETNSKQIALIRICMGRVPCHSQRGQCSFRNDEFPCHRPSCSLHQRLCRRWSGCTHSCACLRAPPKATPS